MLFIYRKKVHYHYSMEFGVYMDVRMVACAGLISFFRVSRSLEETWHLGEHGLTVGGLM